MKASPTFSGLAESRRSIEGEQIEVEVVVLPNAMASVTLPGSDDQPIEVGAGTHRWSYPYHFERVLQPLSLDNTISEFIDDPETWTTVLTTCANTAAALQSPGCRQHHEGGSEYDFGGNSLPSAAREAVARGP